MWSRNRALFCLLFVLAFFVAVDSNNWPYSQSAKRIINGWITDIYTFPHHVAIVHRIVQTVVDKWEYKCGGSIITYEWILTAAHCLVKNKQILTPSGVKVATGQENSEYYWQYVYDYFAEVTQVVVHPGYNHRPPIHDIALLKLKYKLAWSEKIKPAILPYRHTEWPGDRLYMVGFGFTAHSFPREYPLRAGVANILDNYVCTEACGCLDYKDGRNICFTHSFYSPCYGDSGGGLLYDLGYSRYILIGIISGGHQNCSIKTITEAIKVKYYLPWIEQYLYERL